MKLLQLCLISSFLLACQQAYPGAGQHQTQVRTVNSFAALNLHHGAELVYTENNRASLHDLQLTTDYNLFALLSTQVQDQRLEIRWLQPVQPTLFRVAIEGPTLREFVLTGASRGSINRLVGQQQLRFALTGQSQLTAESVESDQISISLSSDSQMNITAGRASVLQLSSLSGGSRLQAENLTAGQVEAVLTGSGTQARVHASRTLIVSLRDGAVLYYKGNPQIEVREMTGNAQLRAID